MTDVNPTSQVGHIPKDLLKMFDIKKITHGGIKHDTHFNQLLANH